MNNCHVDNNLSRIQNAVAHAPSISGIKIVGIDGPSGSGKSTLAGKLAFLLKAPVIQIDDFVSWNDFSGWWPRLEAQVLDPLLRRRPAVYQQRDWESDEFGDSLGMWATVDWSPVVIIEGVTCTRQSSVGKIAVTIWVEAPKEERLRRGIERDGEDHRGLWDKWMETERKFFDWDETRSRADIIVPGT
ncbi:hypothetical protein AU252_21460 [Pseudarthrobacter sulfonivorans]|uniref:(d)CMP kinase n=1 Tax=Pseudarthrobacter sulfonivorans TaxID=121292 RepID=A0A0U3QBG3_9MICC|nr:hypothetical protein AU252_21460 [Pseudarthrobacter sulfonivorans]